MRHLFILIYAGLVERYRKVIMLSNLTMKLMFIPGFNGLRVFNSKARAYAEFVRAKNNVPAYRQFLKSKKFAKPSFSGIIPNISEIPYTDKENYVKLFLMEERCVDGRIPSCGVVIDESSGSSGTATNWARGTTERKRNARFIKFGMQHLLGDNPLFVINAFALGPWATGVNITMSCVTFSKLKSLGPDKTKIENTIKDFGKAHNYVIMGYPPFLKMLVDNSDINWKEYNTTFIFGGESMSEGMRDYLMEKGIRKIYSSFGASDLELNISAENDFTISLRRLLRSNGELHKRIVKYPGALPMLFQFNPADFFIETSNEGELIITICRPGYIAPKIRYNIHDRGHVLQMKELYAILKELNINAGELEKPSTDLPILLHYGRADMTVSFFGSNISPIDIQESLFNLPELAGIVNSFCISAVEDKDGNKQLIISLELQKDKEVSLIDLDQEAKKMLTSSKQTVIKFYKSTQGPFEKNDMRIKARYLQ
jgi:phenylacetate-CoA ligase